MGQYWFLACIDRREITSYDNGLKLGETMLQGYCDMLCKMLAYKTHFIRSTPLPVTQTVALKDKKLSAIEELPDLIIDMIFSSLTEYSYMENPKSVDAILCFALSCHRFLDFGRRHLLKDFKLRSQPENWSGHRIICVGDYADDIPPGFLSDYECEELGNRTLFEFVKTFGGPSRLFAYTPARTYHHAGKTASKRLIKALLPEFRNVSQRDKDTVIRNLTTDEYIRAEAFHATLDKFNLEDMLLSRIGWSSDPSVALVNKVGFHRGTWAGHCIDLNTADTVDSTWKDVTKESYEWIKTIYEDQSDE
ncbi:hypothetical protein BX661DRAFT_181282 [Kickxella alabastrina]|uniref:uncharacterized protein n=1 Tax=Kickxella alabastrina TaxID=61397 RepID=UPI00221F8771|nr:uncharacterized protein BX661DRAFT_184098 [Kickxella alabastrina]XP_051392054.1 uncharacterized protein BX661DRAFT_181282 [Kickxella alabastrina]KAI7826471.1 hypothetical protein BX661DRAFT_184098 [Kickxella alabastrina]KAI7829041.1 hypothetical protein BX661DRAFT_181282 [Kickxella alabastrina]